MALTEKRQLCADSLLAHSYPDLDDEALRPLRSRLIRLAQNPPQVLLFDGGTEEKRRSLAKYWAACNLCERPSSEGPCLACATCHHIQEEVYPDLIALDGGVSKKEEEEEEEGFYRAFNAENARSLRALSKVAPRASFRVCIITGISQSRPEAPNALLKILEEPNPSLLFILLTPHRDQILPTLVSRSFCLTLPWPESPSDSKEVCILLSSLAQFLSNKDDFLEKVSTKGAVTFELAHDFIVACQNALIRVYSKELKTDLDFELAKLSPSNLFALSVWLKDAQNMLNASVSPSRLLEGLAMRLASLYLAK